MWICERSCIVYKLPRCCLKWKTLKLHIMKQEKSRDKLISLCFKYKCSIAVMISWYKLQYYCDIYLCRIMKTMRWDITVNVLLLLLRQWQICTILCTLTQACLIEITGLFLRFVSCHCHSPVMYSPVCLYTVCNTIIIIRRASGLNKPVFASFSSLWQPSFT